MAQPSGRQGRAVCRLTWAAIIAASVGSAPPVAAQAPDADAVAVVELAPSLIQLASAPVPVAVQVREVPRLGAFDLTLTFDPAHAVVTAVEPGDYLATADGPGTVTIRTAQAGRLRLSGAIPPPAEAPLQGESGEGSGAAATAPDAEPPALTAGTLALVTFAPLQRSEGSVAVEVVAVDLSDAEGAAVEATGLTAQLTVVDDPTDEARAEAERQAAALAETVENNPLGGIAGSVERAFQQVSRQLRGVALNPIMVWLAILVGALGVVGLGWQLGRRPAADDRHGAGTV